MLTWHRNTFSATQTAVTDGAEACVAGMISEMDLSQRG
jgi:hypothetical protein